MLIKITTRESVSIKRNDDLFLNMFHNREDAKSITNLTENKFTKIETFNKPMIALNIQQSSYNFLNNFNKHGHNSVNNSIPVRINNGNGFFNSNNKNGNFFGNSLISNGNYGISPYKESNIYRNSNCISSNAIESNYNNNLNAKFCIINDECDLCKIYFYIFVSGHDLYTTAI